MPIRFPVRISETAERDVDDIWRFISQDSVIAAVGFLSQLEERVATLETFPARCPLIPENDLIGTQYRHLIYGDYRLIFRIEAKRVYVLRIIHSARLLDATALEDED
ncbi:MAG: type II toxin-antitoxin system RelE/ParE family toxin [Pyrinomonadaceae bacterium]